MDPHRVLEYRRSHSFDMSTYPRMMMMYTPENIAYNNNNNLPSQRTPFGNLANVTTTASTTSSLTSLSSRPLLPPPSVGSFLQPSLIDERKCISRVYSPSMLSGSGPLSAPLPLTFPKDNFLASSDFTPTDATEFLHQPTPTWLAAGSALGLYTANIPPCASSSSSSSPSSPGVNTPQSAPAWLPTFEINNNSKNNNVNNNNPFSYFFQPTKSAFDTITTTSCSATTGISLYGFDTTNKNDTGNNNINPNWTMNTNSTITTNSLQLDIPKVIGSGGEVMSDGRAITPTETYMFTPPVQSDISTNQCPTTLSSCIMPSSPIDISAACSTGSGYPATNTLNLTSHTSTESLTTSAPSGNSEDSRPNSDMMRQYRRDMDSTLTPSLSPFLKRISFGDIRHQSLMTDNTYNIPDSSATTPSSIKHFVVPPTTSRSRTIQQFHEITFHNLTANNKKEILSGVAPSGSSKRKLRQSEDSEIKPGADRHESNAIPYNNKFPGKRSRSFS